MIFKKRPPRFTIERLEETGGHCACCGRESRSVAGLASMNNRTYAAYWMHWTIGHLHEQGANLDLVLGKWGDGTSPADRVAVALVHREQADGTPALMIIDASDRPAADGRLANVGLRRDEVIGTPLAALIFSLTDAIYEQDGRFF